MIKTTPRASVAHDFIDQYRKLAVSVIKTMERQIGNASEGYKASYLKRHNGAVARLLPIAKNTKGPGIGIDFEVARMRALDYEAFKIVEIIDDIYFVGKTRPTIMQAYNGRAKTSTYDIGAYYISIPFKAFTSSRMSDIAMIPERDIGIRNRHPHHKIVTSDYYPENLSQAIAVHPSTCWASIGPVFSNALRNMDIVEAFRTLHIFISRYDIKSPLVDVGYCSHIRRI